MAQLVVRNLEDAVKERLKRRARRNGRSTEEEVRDILRNAVKAESPEKQGFGSRFAAHFAKVGLQDGEEIPELRGLPVRPAVFK